MKKTLINFFDKIEDRIRGRLSHRAIFYAFIGGIFTVMFWRGVWMTADFIESTGGFMKILFSGPISLIVAIIVLMITGLFVSVFIGEKIIISGLKQEKKVFDKTELEIKEESSLILDIKLGMNKIRQEMAEIRGLIEEQKQKDL